MLKRFFGLEILFVFIIIGFLAGVFFLAVQSSHSKTQIAAYMTYAEQMQRLVSGAVASGYLDHYTTTELVCLGKYTAQVHCVDDVQLNTHLEKISTIPDPAVVSPYNEKLGVAMYARNIDQKAYIEIRVGISEDVILTQEICNQFGWGSDNSSYCYIHIKKTSR